MGSQAAIVVDQVRKSFKSFEALKGLSLEIPTGEFFGLLGPNGAGKTTIIKTIIGLARPSSGIIRVFGEDAVAHPVKTKAVLGYSPQEPNIDRYFQVRRTLEFQGGYFGMPRAERRRRAEELMEQFRLSDKADEEYWKLSGGMQKRLLIARALMTHPRILILDEPTSGVDVEQRHELWNYLKGLNRDGTTIILTTHYIDEAEALCERVAMIHAGQIVEMGDPVSLIQKHGQKDLEDVFLKLTGKYNDRLLDAH